MKLDSWNKLLERVAPVATVSLDVSRTQESAPKEVHLRWEAARDDLARHGAPIELLEVFEPIVTAETGLGGSLGRVTVVDAKGTVLVDEVFRGAPARAEALLGPVPQLMPLIRAIGSVPPYLLVQVDRNGGDVEYHGPGDGPEHEWTVEGGHDVVHQVRGGGWSHLRFQHRVEDSLERNTEAVAVQVDQLFRRYRPEVVLVAGYERAVSHFRDRVGAEVKDVLEHLGGGGRADGVDEQSFRETVQTALDNRRRQTTDTVLERYRQGEGRQDTAVQGLAAVVDGLRRGQVDEVLLHDDASSTFTLWVGDEPLEIGTTESEVSGIGARRAQEVRADAAIAWACLGSGAGITLLDDDQARMEDGIGAVLRWSDASTPHESLASMPGHGEPRGGEPVT